MGGLEFFTSGDEVWWQDADGIHPLTESSPIIPIIIDRIKELYPKAFDALCECYAKQRGNVGYFRFLIARRFCKCNFGNLDHTKEDVNGIFNFEKVACPLQGECPFEGRICMPEMTTSLSDAEKRVMKLVCEGRSNQEIAEDLFLSPNTVKRHISVSYLKTKTRNRAEFVRYSKDNNLFL